MRYELADHEANNSNFHIPAPLVAMRCILSYKLRVNR